MYMKETFIYQQKNFQLFLSLKKSNIQFKINTCHIQIPIIFWYHKNNNKIIIITFVFPFLIT